MSDREQELATEMERLALENAALLKENSRLLARLRDQPDPERRVTRAMVSGMREDLRIVRDQVALILEEVVKHAEAKASEEDA